MSAAIRATIRMALITTYAIFGGFLIIMIIDYYFCNGPQNPIEIKPPIVDPRSVFLQKQLNG